MKKTEAVMNKPVYLALSLLDLCKILMHEVWYHCIKAKFKDNAKLCNMHADCFIVYTKNGKCLYRYCKSIETRSDIYEIYSYEIEKLLSIEK